MSESLLHPLFARYQADPTAPISLPESPTHLEALLDEAKNGVLAALEQNDRALAEQIVAFAWAVARQEEDGPTIAWAHWCNGLLLLFDQARSALAHLEKARDYYQQGGDDFLEGRVLIGVAGLLGQLGQLERADEAMQRAMACLAPYPEDPRWMAVYINYSDIKARQAEYSASLKLAARGAQLAQRLGHRPNQARALINQARAWLGMGELERAEQELREALLVARETGSGELIGRALWNRVRLLGYRGTLFAALRLLDEARHYFGEADLHLEQAGTVRMEEARLYERLKMPREARAAAIQAAEVFSSAGHPTESMEARMTAARLLLAEQKATRAREQLGIAQTLAPQLSAQFQALLQGYLAHPLVQQEAESGLEQADEAAARLQELGARPEQLEIELVAAALAAALRRPDAGQRYERVVSQAQAAGLLPLEQRACAEMAQQLPAGEAWPWLRRAADLVALERRQMPMEELKANLLSGHATLYHRLIEAYLQSNQPEAALQTLFEAKGAIWADLAAPAAEQVTDPAWVRAREELHFWQEQQESATEPAHVQTRIHQAKEALASLARRQLRQRPLQALPSLEDVQGSLPQNSVLVEYLLCAHRLYGWVIPPRGEPQWVALGHSDSVKPLVHRLGVLLTAMRYGQSPQERASEARNQLPVLEEILRQLYAILVAPLAPHLPPEGTLLLAPDGFLFDIPWAALRHNAGTLGEQYSLLLYPSAILPALSPPSETAADEVRLLGFPGTPPLLHVAGELAAIQRCLPEARCLLPAQSNDLLASPAPRLLHVAAHARAEAHAPLLSHIALADGPFLLADALTLPLHGTRLVTLSGCETLATPERGGVLLALAGAFLTAGAGSVLASLWPVEDEATEQFMASFYLALRQGLALPVALQQAQRALRDQGYEHPYYWAAFQPLSREIATPILPSR